MGKNINIIAEVQTTHKEKSTKEFNENIDILKDMTGRHEVDINIGILKRAMAINNFDC